MEGDITVRATKKLEENKRFHIDGVYISMVQLTMTYQKAMT